MQFRNVLEIDLGEVDYSEMTDGEGTSGTYTFTDVLPAGFLPIAAKVQTMEAFVGDTSAGAELGTVGDPNAFLSTKNVFAVDTINALPGGDMDVAIDAESDVVLKITGASDFSDFTAGKVACSLYCIDLNEPETVDTN